MRQPELGKKISALRKSKGLTQEELVEKCNLNVRTIQRIEAGEVTPRSYTVKALFEALDYQWMEEEKVQDLPKKPPVILYVAFAMGLIYFFLAFFEIDMEVNYLEEGILSNPQNYVLIKAFTFLTYVIFIYGWVEWVKFYPNAILKIALWVMILANLIMYSLDIFSIYSERLALEDYYLVKLSVFGLAYAFMGAGFLAYKSMWSHIPQVVGGLGLISGILIFSGIGVLLGLIPLTLFELGQLAMMIWGINEIGRENSPDLSLQP